MKYAYVKMMGEWYIVVCDDPHAPDIYKQIPNLGAFQTLMDAQEYRQTYLKED